MNILCDSKWHLWSFCKCLGDTVKNIGKRAQGLQNCLNEKFAKVNNLENDFKVLNLPLGEKYMFWVFKILFFRFFCKYLGGKLKPSLWKGKYSLQNHLNQKFAIASILGSGFETISKW